MQCRSLVVLDRMGSAGLGRPCAIWEEEYVAFYNSMIPRIDASDASRHQPTHARTHSLCSIDLELPLEVDDEYLTLEAGFAQPPHKPSRMAYFNYAVKLSQILIGALRTIVSALCVTDAAGSLTSRRVRVRCVRLACSTP
jgi:hypothetical protein